KVRLEKTSLSISASRTLEKKGMVFMDQRPEEVSKRIKLPMEVDQDAAFSAKYLNGVLTIKIPVKGSRSIKVE
ncbi:MAG TPA: Hsp20/alpha crystallin family protein, partial [Thermoplasmataceae archaeon]|nr:Hsp20/alpha crystallin family protein [Thermoplasmataceae archaeon]